MPPKVREIIKLLEQNGWVLVRQRGSHRVFRHPAFPNLVVLPGNLGDEIAMGTLHDVLKQVRLNRNPKS